MNTTVLSHKILLIENDQVTADAVHAALAMPDNGSFQVEWVRWVSEGLERITNKGINAVLLGSSLPDMHGTNAFDRLFTAAPDIPIVILATNDDEVLAKEAVKRGAQDYLLSSHLDAYSLNRALRNAIERKIVEDALFVERERAVVTLNSIGDGVLCTDISGNVTYLNLVAETMTGWPRQEATGEPLAKVFAIIDGGTRQTAQDPMEMAMEQNRTVGLTTNCILIRRDGYESAIEDSAAPIHDRGGRVIGAVIVFHDVSIARAMSIQMNHSAHHDVLTDLPNRLLINDRISQSIALAKRHHGHSAVLFVDLDRFKHINDSLGHAVGDKLLQSVAKRLLGAVRGSDTVSRQGGDEFVILLSEIAFPEDASISAKKILQWLNPTHVLGRTSLEINASIGISIYPEDGEDAATLIKNADAAMYHAKERGRNNVQRFTADMNADALELQSLEGSIRHALERGEFLLHYQPKVNLKTGEIVGVEALIRWQRPERGLVPPSQFVPIAEDCGLILDIGRWTMREACRQAKAWQSAGLPAMRISVNVSAMEFRNKDFVENVRQALAETRLKSRYLELELTEGVLMEDAESTVSVLQELKTMGLHLAVDDFGTGYSSLSYLRKFPIDVLKIDQSFVHEISGDPGDSALVSAIINMAKSLKQVVVAEGIETREQRQHLQTLHCPQGQGFLFSRPVMADQLADLLRMGVTGTCVH